MAEWDEVAGHVFISYVREDSLAVDQLQRTFEAAGIPVWRDTASLWPGQDWQARIERAITEGALVFIACFSSNSFSRETSFQNEELALAIGQLRLRAGDDPWLIPVCLDDCVVPARDIGGGRTLASIHRADLFGEGYGEGIARLVATVLRVLGRRPVASGRAPPGPGAGGDAAAGTMSAAIGQLVRDAAGVGFLPEAALRLARSEIERVAWFVRGLGEGRATYYGEDQDWLLTLARQARMTIDATSTTHVDGGMYMPAGGARVPGFAGGFWHSALGQRYLSAQRAAANRGVAIRRLFILSLPSSASCASIQPGLPEDDEELKKICSMQIKAGVKVRILGYARVPDALKSLFYDFAIFDGELCYEVIPAPRLNFSAEPTADKTDLTARTDYVQGRRALFEELWELGQAAD